MAFQNDVSKVNPTLVLCLGNEVLSDDGFGAVIATEINKRSSLRSLGEVFFASVAGFALIDLLKDRKSALIVDTIQTGKVPPGTLHTFRAGVFTPSKNLITSHQISLPTALEFGSKMGINMPQNIDILAVEAFDIETLSEQLTPDVQQAVLPALDFIANWLENQKGKNDGN